MKINVKKIIKKAFFYYPFIVFFLIVVYSSRKFLFKNGSIIYGEFLGSDNYFFFLKQFLSAWGNYTTFGHSNIGLTTSYGLNTVFWIIPPGYNIPFLFFLSLFQIISGSLAVKMHIFLALIMPFFGMYFFANYWFKKISQNHFILSSLTFISAIIFSLSSLMGDRISAGHERYNIAHGLFPLLFLFTFRAIEEKQFYLRKLFILASGLIIGIMIWLMPHLINLYLIVLGFYFFVFILGSKDRLKKFFIVTIVSGLIGVLLNIHLWLPALFFREELAYVNDPSYSTAFVYFISHNTKLIDVISLASGFEQKFINQTVYKNLILLKLLMPVLAIIGLIINRERKKSLFLFLVGLTGLIFSLGVNYPFEKIYYFLYKNVFLFKPFREPSKFGILYLFSLSLFIPYIFFYINRYLNKLFLFILVALFTFFILYINPNFTIGNFGSTIIPFDIPKKYRELNQFLSKKQGDFRVAVYPNNQSIGDYTWIAKTSNGSPYTHIFLLNPLPKNLANSNNVITDWSSRYLDYLESNLDQPWAIQRLGEEMTRYIIVDPSLSNYVTYLQKLRTNSGLKEIDAVADFFIFELTNYNQKKLVSKSAVYYYGNIYGIKKLPSDTALINLALNPSDILSGNFSDTIILDNASLDDVFYVSLKQYAFSFFPEVRFAKEPAKEFFSPGDYLRSLTLKGITFYNPEIVQTVGPNTFSKKSNLKPGKYKILLSTLSHEKETNSIKITIEDSSIIKNNFRRKNNTFEWLDLGEIEVKQNNPMVTIENLENLSLLVDYFLIIPSDQFNNLRNGFYSKIKSKKIINLEETDIFDQNVLQKNKNMITVFSNSFSPYWSICENQIFRVNFFSSGALCKQSLKLSAKFKPEFIYRLSTVLSAIFYITIIFALIKINKIKKNDYWC